VGPIRKDCALENGLCVRVSGDQLLKGAASTAVQIAEEYRVNNSKEFARARGRPGSGLATPFLFEAGLYCAKGDEKMPAMDSALTIHLFGSDYCACLTLTCVPASGRDCCRW